MTSNLDTAAADWALQFLAVPIDPQETVMRKMLALALASLSLAVAPVEASPIWRQVPAEWASPPQMVRSLTEWNGNLVVGTGRPQTNGAEVYRLEDGVLKKRAGFGSQRVVSMSPGPNGELFVGVGTSNSGAALFGKYLTDTLTPSGIIDGTAANWKTLKTFPNHSFVYSMAWHSGKLHVGVMSNTTPGAAEVWRFDDPGLTKVGGPGVNGWPANDTAVGVYELWDFDGKLYASTFSYAPGDGNVYELTPTGWVDIGFPDTLIPLAMATYDGHLVASLQNNVGVPNPIFQRVDGQWVPLGNAPADWAGAWLPNHMVTGPDGHLYVAFGGNLGSLQVWRYDGAWTKMGGDGLSGSWTDPVSSSPAAAEWFYRMIWFDGKLYVGIAANGGGFAALWEMTP